MLADIIDFCIYLCIPLHILVKIFNKFNNLIIAIICFCIFLIFFVCFVAKDILFNKVSLGKQIFKLCIYDENNNIITTKSLLIKRVIVSYCFGMINIFTILIQNKTIGDYIFKTNIDIEKK